MEKSENASENQVSNFTEGQSHDKSISDFCPKEDLGNKLSDSACGSLNESEDSGTKEPQDHDGLDESDSLGCDDKDDLEESDIDDDHDDEEEESVDNNTFNVINTENSESQEISELTNDDSSNCDKTKSNDGHVKVTNAENGENNSDLTSSEVHDANDISEESNDLTRDEEVEEEEDIEVDVSLGEEEESSKSKRSEDQTETSEDPAMEISSTDSTDKNVEKVEQVTVDKSESSKTLDRAQVETKKSTKPSAPNIVSRKLEHKSKTNSPKVRKRLGLPNSNFKNSEFKIEIFESKRKPELSSSTNENESLNATNPPQINVENNKNQSQDKITTPNIRPENESEKCSLESPLNSDKLLLSEPSTSTSDILSPDSGEKTSSIMLDVSQVIKEESEESDAMSPIKSLVEDIQSVSTYPSKDKDTSKKNQELESKSKNGEPITLSKESSPPAPVAAVPTTTQHENKAPVVQNEDVKAVGEDVKTSTVEAKKPFPMAFTVDLDSANSDSSASANSGKKLDITASISQWAPKHRRNHSLTKVEEHKKVDEKQGVEKPPLGRPRSGTVGASPLSLKRGGAGYHSEGYFSSDQDDETPKRTELKSPRSPRTPETVQANPLLVRSNSQDSSKGNSSLRMRPPSPLSPTSPYSTPLNETASFLIEKMMQATPETKRKFSTKSEVRTCCKERERKPSVSELTGKSYRSEKKMVTDSKKHTKTVPSDDPDNCKDDKDDDVSEAGTYTIDKDSPSPEEDRARNDIDGVFGVAMTSALESEAEGGGASTITTTTAVPHSTTECLEGEESSWFSASEMPPPALSRNSPNWIQQWAAQVAEQTKPPVIDSHPPLSKASPRTHSSPPEGPINDPRPRRKLPTPPSHLASLSPRSSDPTLSSAKHKARMEKAKGNPAFRNASFESHESGADSDFDTSASYPFNDDERMSASLKSKLRLTGLMPTSKNSVTPPIAATNSPRRSEGAVESKIKSRDPSYDVYNTRRGEDRGLHSDSSSEASEPYKEVARPNDNNPPLKFNRAFSLRRARLGCDDASSATPSPGDGKKKITRPSSAGSAGTGSAGRKGGALGGSSKAYHHSVDSVSSPRGYGGFGSPRGGAAAPAASPSSAVVGSKGCPPLPSPQTDNFDRTDGGRYSLRLPRAGSSSIQGLSKSPSKTSIKKDSPSVGGRKGHSATRSNSTLSSKEVDFQNWKRRKNYDPMKAAAEGRKKQVEKKLKNTQLPSPQQSVNADSHRSPSPPGSLLRSASFHGTEGVMCNMRWNRKGNNNINQTQYTSEDDGPYSLEEEVGPHPSPRHGSPLHRSPTSPHQLCQSPIRHPPLRGRRPSLGLAEGDDAQYQSSIRKVSLDESGSEGKRSPLSSGVVARGATSSAVAATTISSTGSGRPKTKMEALDNLVISTIHSLSVKVRTTSESLLQKLKSQYDEEGDRAALLEEVLSHLSESDQSLTSGQTRSTSRELAGILRNLKKIEHALEVIDRVIIVGEEDYRDEDDIDYVPTEWVEESDY